LDSVSGIGFGAEHGGLDVEISPDITKMVSHNDVLAALILPKFKEATLSNLWDNTITDGGMVAEELNGIKDEGLSMAMGTSKSGLKITTLCVAGNDNKESNLHILFNEESGHSIIVGDSPSLKLKAQFQACQIDFIQRDEKNAEQKIDRALDKMLDGRKGAATEKKSLCNAFLIRNVAPSVEKQDQLKLSSLLLAQDSQTLLPQYVVKL
jgi:hypothetical protein